MPMLTPARGQSQEDFMDMCMSHEMMMDEYPKRDQRMAVCAVAWNDSKKSADSDIEKKSVRLELKAEKAGSFTAMFATLNVIDHDGDITVAGAFPEGKELWVSAYQHGSWQGHLPVGKAIIKSQGDLVIAEGEFNLNTATGREHYETVKFSGGLQEWSYGFRPVDFAYEDREGRQVRVLKKVDPYEISPVLKGAGLATATLGIKNLSESQPYADHAEAVLAAVKALAERTRSLADLRRKEGRVLSTANMARMRRMMEQMQEMMGEMGEMLHSAEPSKAALETLFLEIQKTRTNLLEVLS